jgi:hypothetical protein
MHTQVSQTVSNRLSSIKCLGCGKELTYKPAYHGNNYRVCSDCAEIMQQDFHEDFFKIMKSVSRSLDTVRAK